MSAGDPSLYYRAILGLKDQNKPEDFDVMSLRPDKTEQQVGEELADFFAAISANFDPVDRASLPQTCQESMIIKPFEIEKRLRKCKKPKSMVYGDLFPDLITPLANCLSHLLSNIFNTCLNTSSWPSLWKVENVTVIPKSPHPEDLNGLSNISCTPLFSKVLEFFVLDKLQSKTSPGRCQFGGVKGSSTSRYLIEAWNWILESLENNHCIVNLTSVDFSKAFYTMSHISCLQKLKDHCASDQSLPPWSRGRTDSLK